MLRLSLLRSPTWPDPDADRGHHHFSLLALPARGRLEAGTHRAAAATNSITTAAMQVESHEGKMAAASIPS